jgi:hypothetical protein
MPYVPVNGETEFGGVGGMFPEQMRGAPTLQQEMWATYATNEGGGTNEEGEDTASIEYGANHIGDARQSFTYDAAEPDLTQVAPWNGEEEEE